ncbi:GNAT family N-acetyltransferase [Humibacter ginsenosidimutans]|uniref:GNAT family N-acetyltransferase n=1 Tax=Humibacter ginsenosidimutans TaxID=2599293 RepID=A0A5B8M2Z6_9MICO|nr:GNAT family N-acetyltransferase [Humibacter ginsenosidimutans]QDZ14102.1 GNAT family N-acetyltransferase [Humibacter ginsenosidimutans]
MQLTIDRVVVPESMADDGGDFAAFVDVGNDCALHLWNNDDFVYDPADQLAWFRPSPFRLRMLYLGRLDADPVGRLLVTVPVDEDATTAEIEVNVIPAARRHGIGAALLARGEELVAEAGRVDVSAFTQHVLAGIPHDTRTLMPITGPSGVPADDDATFMVGKGYALGQVEIVSRLGVPLPAELRERLDHDVDAHAHGYRIATWWQRCPDELIDGYAAARARMVLDVPHDGIALDSEHWDAARVRDEEQRHLDSGEPALVAAAVHEATGAVVAYTILLVAQGSTKVEQWDTLVVAGHRGHRLGLAVKLANIDALARIAPGVDRILTWNAGENAPMRAINEAMGFVPYALDGNWQKRLEDPA